VATPVKVLKWRRLMGMGGSEKIELLV